MLLDKDDYFSVFIKFSSFYVDHAFYVVCERYSNSCHCSYIAIYDIFAHHLELMDLFHNWDKLVSMTEFSMWCYCFGKFALQV